MSLKWVYLFISFSTVAYTADVAKLTCDDESLKKKNRKLSKEDIDNLISIDNQSQIKMCLVVLGKDPLETEIAELLWRDLVKVRQTYDNKLIVYVLLLIFNIFYLIVESKATITINIFLFRFIQRQTIFLRTSYSCWDGYRKGYRLQIL